MAKADQIIGTVFDRVYVQIEGAPPRPGLQIRCACGATQVRHVPSDWPTDAVARKFRELGWEVDGKGRAATCPSCLNHKKETASMPKSPLATSVSPDYLRRQARMFDLLRDHYQEDRARYVEGWSDEKIAQETELSTEFIGSARIALYGEMGPPPEVTAALAALEELRRSVAAEAEELRAMVRAMEAEWQSKLDAADAGLQAALKRAA
jgi:hypothetical protein